MCGIWLYLNINKVEIDINNLKKNFNKIKNRGPDYSKLIEHEKYYIGFHRLSINDTSYNGNQPFIHIKEDQRGKMDLFEKTILDLRSLECFHVYE